MASLKLNTLSELKIVNQPVWRKDKLADDQYMNFYQNPEQYRRLSTKKGAQIVDRHNYGNDKVQKKMETFTLRF